MMDDAIWTISVLVCLEVHKTMLVRLASPTRNSHFYPVLHRPILLRCRRALRMVATPTEAVSKRPTCHSCLKPVRICLCSRIQNPGLHNSVSVTILQHSFEKNHPLNSARIARLGLKNVKVVTVFDVHFDARFVIRLSNPDSGLGLDRNGYKGFSFDGVVENERTQNVVSEDCESEIVGLINIDNVRTCGSVIDSIEQCSSVDDDTCGMRNAQNQLGDVDSADNCSLSTCDALLVEQESEFAGGKGVFAIDQQSIVKEVLTSTRLDSDTSIHDGSDLDFDSLECVQSSGNSGGPAITASIGKNGVISSLSHAWMPQAHSKSLKFDALLDIAEARDALAEGFVVQKFQKPLRGNVELDEDVEFEIEVPPGSVLLFPSKEAVGARDLEAMGISVKNLIVLDGTWSKAKRMYVENPWLKLVPHLRVDMDKLSMYNEVRVQPKPGCLSTIESIVYALKAVGDSPEGLDNLLDVFESMVGDQRRCKEERINNVSKQLRL